MIFTPASQSDLPPALPPYQGRDGVGPSAVFAPSTSGLSLPDGTPLLATLAKKALFQMLTGKRGLYPDNGATDLGEVLVWLFLCAHDTRVWWHAPEPEADELSAELPSRFMMFRQRIDEWSDATFGDPDQDIIAHLEITALQLWHKSHRTRVVVHPGERADPEKKTEPSHPHTGPSTAPSFSPAETSASETPSSTIPTSEPPTPGSTPSWLSEASE